MFRYILLGLLLLGAARCEIQLQLTEHSEAPGVSHQSYDLVDKDAEGNGKVVGHVVHIQAGGQRGAEGLQQLGSRRMGAGFRSGPHPLMGLAMPSLLLHLNSVNALPDQLFAQMHQARCAMMRQFNDDFSLLNQRLGVRLAPMFLQAYGGPMDGSAAEGEEATQRLSADADLQRLSGEASESDGNTLFGADVLPAAGAAVSASAGAAAMPPFRLQPVAWHSQGWEGRGWQAHHHQMMMKLRGGEHAGEQGRPHAHHHGWGSWGRKDIEEVPPTVPADWMSLEDAAMPRLPAGEEAEEEAGINWSLRNEDGSLNVGLVLFLALTAACAGVWAAGLASWVSCNRKMREAARGRAQFLTHKPSADLINPLLPEGPMGSPKLYTGVEFAADHVAKEGVEYEPLPKAGK